MLHDIRFTTTCEMTPQREVLDHTISVLEELLTKPDYALYRYGICNAAYSIARHHGYSAIQSSVIEGVAASSLLHMGVKKFGYTGHSSYLNGQPLQLGQYVGPTAMDLRVFSGIVMDTEEAMEFWKPRFALVEQMVAFLKGVRT